MRLTIRQTFFLLLFLGLFIMALRPAADPDFWWHLRTGQFIAETGAIPHADPFSFTNFGKAWITHEWLSELTLYGLFRAGSFPLLIVTFALVITGAFLLAYFNCSKETRPYTAGFATVLAALASAPLWGVRPQMLSLLLTALFLFLLERYQQTRRLRFLVPLPLVTLAWVNLHAGYFLGFGVIGIYILGEGIDFLRTFLRKEKTNLRPALTLTAALALSALAALVNPNTWRILVYPFETLTSDSMMTFIQEWFSPDFHQTMWLPLTALILSLIALPLIARRPVSRTRILLAVVFGFGALRSMRNVPLFAVAVVPLVAEQLAAFLPTGSRSAPPKRVMSLINSLLVGIVILVAGLQVVNISLEQPDSEAENFPKAAVDWIAENRPAGNLYNTYGWGGYLIWRLYPEYQVYIDGRADVYGDEFIYDYMHIYSAQPGWEAALETDGVNTVLLQPGEPLANALLQSEGWQVAFEDEQSVIFIRK